MTAPGDPFDVAGRRALITGASSGLGRHFAGVLASRGAQVTLAARRRAALDAACAGITERGGAAEAAVLDVADERAVAAFFDAAAAFDIVINNAGISRPGALGDLSAADWDDTMAVNLRAPFLVAQAAAAAMRSAGQGGTIVNVASILGLRVAGGVGAYAASKAGLVQLTRAMALEWARDGIRVNALCPGYVETDINRDFFQTERGRALIRRVPQRRLGTPADLDGALLLLASDAGRFMTGAELVVDGGHLVSSL
ncbi:SDR family NAD(P)-dependent oxidoreductase [Rhodovulum sp. 12E13]|uniref:SDR family NAD(P)-dependent oxidoreductase n=1 Tax=Rhodovulum sp. 12E13 TaxID=2203891 RepID=UPI000E146379|nr:glucose 1-dehydrogenase [Rhodovulum sp. 12E13]RDC71237.1 SDR family NAD(P)-dependent oxidoreductase [Rhodovulum sp. 12E13]